MNWPMVTLGEVSKNVGQYGVGLSSREWGDGDPRYIRITDIRDDGRLNASVVAPDGDHSDWNKAILQPGDLLFARSGATVGKTYLHGADAPLAVYAGYLIRFQLDTDRVLPEYAFRFTQSPEYRAWVASSQRAVAQPNINAKQYATLPIPLPPIDEQRRIAATLDHADGVRSARNHSLAEMEVLAGSIFTQMFGSQRHETADLSEVVRPGTIVTYGIVQAGPEHEGGVPYIRTGDIAEGKIQIEGLRHTNPAIASKFERSRVSAGDIVMSIRATVGTTALVPPELDGANLTQGTAKISPSEVAAGPYLLHYLRSPEAQRWIQTQVKGATFREITLGALRQLPVPLVPVTLQKEFEDQIRVLEAARRRALTSSDQLGELFTSLQSRAFAGQL